jgi:hypothetical protein
MLQANALNVNNIKALNCYCCSDKGYDFHEAFQFLEPHLLFWASSQSVPRNTRNSDQSCYPHADLSGASTIQRCYDCISGSEHRIMM